MRGSLLCLALLVCTIAYAAPVQVDPKPAAPELPVHQAHEFATQIYQAATYVSETYVHPVKVPELVQASLVSLYQAADLPVPEDLRVRSEEFGKDANLHELLVKHRLQIRDLEALRGKDIRKSLEGMFKSLDPYTGYMSAQDRRRMYIQQPMIFGVGLTLAEQVGEGHLVVSNVTLGSPAHRARIQLGDRIAEVDRVPVTEIKRTLAEIEAMINGFGAVQGQREVGEGNTNQVKLRILSGEAPPRVVDLNREYYREEAVLGIRRTEFDSWDFILDARKKIALVRLQYLGVRSRDELDRVVQDLSARGIQKLILDMRECPGGFLNESIQIADLFLGDCLIAEMNSRTESKSRTYRSQLAASQLDMQMVLLIGPETTGGGELVAAALQDNGRALLIGQRTRGKASVQENMPLASGEAKITTGIFLRPSGKNMNRFANSKSTDDWGVDPDHGHEIRLTPELRERLRHWWRLNDLRPLNTKKVLPLDFLDSDPILMHAIRALEAGVKPKKQEIGQGPNTERNIQ